MSVRVQSITFLYKLNAKGIRQLQHAKQRSLVGTLCRFEDTTDR
jgi:hypothetical protein